jgi:hypothetical protein
MDDPKLKTMNKEIEKVEQVMRRRANSRQTSTSSDDPLRKQTTSWKDDLLDYPKALK